MLQLIKSADLYSSGHVTDVNGSHYTNSLWEEDLGYRENRAPVFALPSFLKS